MILPQRGKPSDTGQGYGCCRAMGVAKKSLLAVLGFAQLGSSGDGMLLGLLRINHNDNWLHALVGVVLIVSGLAKKASAHPVSQVTHLSKQQVRPSGTTVRKTFF